MLGEAADGGQLQHRNHREAHQGAHRGPLDPQLRPLDQGIVHRQLGGAAQGHLEHRQEHLSVGLQDGAAQKLDAHKDRGHPQHQQGSTGHLLVGVGEEHTDDGAGEQGQAHPGGHGQEGPHPQGGFRDLPRPPAVLPGEAGGHRRDNAGREGHHEGGGEVINGDGLLKAAIKGRRGLGAVAQGALQEVLHLDGVQAGGDGHHRGTDGNGDGDLRHGLEDVSGGIRGAVPQGGLVGSGPAVLEHQIGQGHQTADGDPPNGPGGDVLAPQALLQEIPGQGQSRQELNGGLQHLGDACGGHVPLALGIAPVGGHGTDEEAGQGQGPDRGRGEGVALEAGQGVGKEEHNQAAEYPQGQKGVQGDPEHPLHLPPPPQGGGLGDGLGHGHRQAGSGHHQQQVVDGIGVVEIGKAGVVQDIPQGDFIEGTDELSHGNAGGQDGGPAKEGAAFGLGWFHGGSFPLFGIVCASIA